MGFYQWFDKQNLGIKVLLLIPIWGWVFSLLYRIDKFIENKDVASLVGFILVLVIGFVINIVDLVTVCMDGTIKFLVYGGENFGIEGTIDSNNNSNSSSNSNDTKNNE